MSRQADKNQGHKRQAKALSIRRLKKLIKEEKIDYDPEELERLRPKKRSDCIDGPRPCPWVGCKYNLYLDVNPRTGSIILNFPDKEPWELEETCVLDIADRGPVTLEEIGHIMNLTRERIRQLEATAIKRINDNEDVKLEFYEFSEVELVVPQQGYTGAEDHDAGLDNE